MRSITNLWHWLLSWIRHPRPEFNTELVEELPEKLAPQTVYLVGSGSHHWSAALLCPCGCGDYIHLNLLKETRPRWSVSVAKKCTPTIHPSIWRTKGCKSHFFVVSGFVVWAPDGTEQQMVGR